MITRAQIVNRAKKHVGHREASENDSPLIRSWLALCGIFKPSPWCAAFASWCVDQRQEKKTGAIVDVNTAGALNLARLFLLTTDPQPGDLMFFPTGGGKGHIGIVVAVGDIEVLCIEGNSKNMVRYVRRLRSEVSFANTRPAEEWLGPQEWPAGAPLVRVELEGTR